MVFRAKVYAIVMSFSGLMLAAIQLVRSLMGAGLGLCEGIGLLGQALTLTGVLVPWAGLSSAKLAEAAGDCPRWTRGCALLVALVPPLAVSCVRLGTRGPSCSDADAAVSLAIDGLVVVLALGLSALIVKAGGSTEDGAAEGGSGRGGVLLLVLLTVNHSLDVAGRDPLLVGVADHGGRVSPLDGAGLASRLSFWWMGGLLELGARRQLEMDDVPGLPRADNSTDWARRFQHSLAVEGGAVPSPSLLRALSATFGAEWRWLGALQLLNDLLSFSGPMLLHAIVMYVQRSATGELTPLEARRAGALLLCLVVGSYLLNAILSTQYGFRMSRVQLHIRTGLVAAVYRKVGKGHLYV
jgi:hypothetical protein